MRTINEIYQQIIQEKNNMPILKEKLLNEDGTTSLSSEQDLLTSLQSDSKVAIWKLWAYITAVAIWFHEAIFEAFKEDVNKAIDEGIVGTGKWLRIKTLEFQYGDTLVITEDNYAPHYDVVDETKRIIASASVSEYAGNVIVKVRRKDTDILSAEEKTALIFYLQKMKFAGQRIILNNYPADKLRLYFTIYYNGMYPLSEIQGNVETAINNYIENIEFDGVVNITKLIDTIQQVEGVEGVYWKEGAGLPATSTQWTNIQNYYYPVAGYCTIHENYPLNQTITYVAQ